MPIGTFSLGDFELGGTGESGVVELLDIRIQDTKRTSLYYLDSLSIEGALGQRSAARFRLADRTQTLHFLEGQLVRVHQGLDVIFAGTIEEVAEEAPLAGGVTFHDITCVDFNQLADRFLVADAYENTLAGDILKDIVNSATPLWKEGVSVAGVEDGIIINRISFNYVKASQAFSDVAEAIGYVWFIDEDRILRFFERSLNRAPYSFSSIVQPATPVPQAPWSRTYSSARYRRSRTGYRNRQFLRAGKMETDEQIEQFLGDGETASWTLRFELARGPTVGGVPLTKPRIYEDINSTGTFTEVAAAKIGVRGVDDEDKTTPENKANPVKADFDFWYFYNKGEKQITQNHNFLTITPKATLDGNDKLRVEYVGQIPMIERQDNAEEQAARKAVEGGTGIYEEIEDDESIDGADFAEERCAAILGREDQILEEMEIETFLAGFRVGQLAELDFPEHQVTGDWVIQDLSMRLLADIKWQTTLRFIAGEKRPSEFDFWRRIREAGRQFVVRENERLLILQKSTERVLVGELTTITQSNVVAPITDDDFILFMGRGRMGRSRMGGD